MESQRFSLYKEKGALQLSLLPPRYVCEKCGAKNFSAYTHPEGGNCEERMEARPGAVLLEIASATGKRVYDWGEKITLAFSVGDMGVLLNAFQKNTSAKLFHDPKKGREGEGEVIKTLQSTVLEDGNTLISVTEKNKSGTRTHKVMVTPPELTVVRVLLAKGIEKSLGW